MPTTQPPRAAPALFRPLQAVPCSQAGAGWKSPVTIFRGGTQLCSGLSMLSPANLSPADLLISKDQTLAYGNGPARHYLAVSARSCPVHCSACSQTGKVKRIPPEATTQQSFPLSKARFSLQPRSLCRLRQIQRAYRPPLTHPARTSHVTNTPRLPCRAHLPG